MLVQLMLASFAAVQHPPAVLIGPPSERQRKELPAYDVAVLDAFGNCLAQIGDGDGIFPVYGSIKLEKRPDGKARLIVPEETYRIYCMRGSTVPVAVDALVFVEGFELEISGKDPDDGLEDRTIRRYSYDLDSKKLKALSVFNGKNLKLGSAMAEPVRQANILITAEIESMNEVASQNDESNLEQQ